MENTCFQTYLALCHAFQIPEPWHQLGTDCNAFVTPSADDALRELSSRHSQEELLDAGLVRRGDDGNLAMHFSLVTSGATVLALADPKSNNTYNLLTDAGCIQGEQSPGFAILDDKHTEGALARTDNNLFLTSDLEDAIVLRVLGLAAVPVRCLNELDEQDLVQLEQRFGIKHQSSRRDFYNPWARKMAAGGQTPSGSSFAAFIQSGRRDIKRNRPIRLTIVPWSIRPASLTEAVQVRNAIQYLQQLQEFQQLEIDKIQEWVPSAKSWQRLKFALARKEPYWIKNAVLDSLDADIAPLGTSDRNAVNGRKPDDLVAANTALYVLLQEKSNGNSYWQRWTVALRTFQKLHWQQIIQPLFAQACSRTDPVERRALFRYAQLSDLYANKMLSLQEHQRDADRRAPDRRDKSVAELLAIDNQLVTLEKEFARWKIQPKTSAPSARSLNTISISHFAASG